MQTQTYPSELNEIEKEIVNTNNDLNDIKLFRDKYTNDFVNNQNENTRFNLNELEIAYNLLYVILLIKISKVIELKFKIYCILNGINHNIL